jgi:hypothetical protein
MPGAGPGGPADAGGEAGGEAAAKARELIAELSGQAGGTAPSIPNQPPGGAASLPPAPPGAPATPYLPPDSPVPSFGGPGDGAGAIPSYAPQDPSGLGFATEDAGLAPDLMEPRSPGQWSDGTEPPPPGRLRRGHSDGDHDQVGEGDRAGRGSRRLLPLLLLLVVLLGAGYLVKTQLLDSSDDTTTAPPVRTSAPSTSRTLSAAELAASLKDPHFKHGYDWAKTAAGSVAAADRESTCRTEALKERESGYPWGAHDRAGCLVALNGG